MKRKLIYRLASLGLAISCALVSIPVEGLSGVLTVYAEEATEPVEPMEEATEMVESTEEIIKIVEPIEETYFDATNVGYATGAIFVNSTISNLVIGNNVEYIDTWTFDGAKFLFDELTLSVKTIGHDAFRKVWDETNPGKLTLTNAVETIEYNAFAMNHFSTVNYDCSATTNAWSLPQGVFYHSNIDELLISSTVTVIPRFMFNQTYLNFDSLTIDVESIEERAFGSLWAEQQAGTLTLTERVNFISDSAFAYGNYAMLNYNANADSDAGYDIESIFYQSKIGDLAIGSNVTKLPGWLFYKSIFGCDEM